MNEGETTSCQSCGYPSHAGHAENCPNSTEGAMAGFQLDFDQSHTNEPAGLTLEGSEPAPAVRKEKSITERLREHSAFANQNSPDMTISRAALQLMSLEKGSLLEDKLITEIAGTDVDDLPYEIVFNFIPSIKADVQWSVADLKRTRPVSREEVDQMYRDAIIKHFNTARKNTGG